MTGSWPTAQPDDSDVRATISGPGPPHLREWGDQETVRYFPEHFLSELTAVFLLFAALTALCIVLPAGLDVKARPMATPVGSKPEWYFLFLSAYLRFVPPVVGALTPVAAVIGFTLLPFLDRNRDRRPSRRLVAIISSILVLVTIISLTILGALE